MNHTLRPWEIADMELRDRQLVFDFEGRYIGYFTGIVYSVLSDGTVVRSRTYPTPWPASANVILPVIPNEIPPWRVRQ